MRLDPADTATAAAATTTVSRPISPLPHRYLPQLQQTLPIRAQTPHFVYPLAPKGVGAPDHGVSADSPPPSMVCGGSDIRGMHLDYITHAPHVNAAAAASPPVKKAAPRSAVSDINGGKDTSAREESQEDTYMVVKD